MSRFYASVQGDVNKKTITKCGHRQMTAHIRGWDIGARIEMGIDEQGEDTVKIYVTSGSNGKKPDKLLAEVNKDF